MLRTIGVRSTEELIEQVIPDAIRLKKPLNLPPQGMSEYQFAAHIRAIAGKNKLYRSLIGMGYYGTATPAVIQRNVFENPAWYTSYTPYQAEISQGRLEALLNFQTAVISLTGMEVGNCSLLDTPFGEKKAGTMEDTLRLLSIIRLLQPHVLLPSTTALGTIHPLGREKGIQAGANVVMPNLSPVAVREKYKLYDNKICTGDEAAECRHCMARRMESVGYKVVVNRGDYH